MTEAVRLAKTVVALTQCSRREAELYIEGGWVTVDGQVVEEPQFMITDQKVELLADAKPEAIEVVTIVMHKPPGYDSDEGDKPAWKLLSAESCVTEHTDPPMRTLRRHFARLTVPMRLAVNASGLLVLTQDFQVNKKLTDDASKIEQEYVVDVTGAIAEGGIEQLNRGITANGWRLPSCKVSWQSEQRLRFAAKDIRGAQIESMCEAVGLQATLIKRIRIGSVAMGKLQPGQWRYLPAFKRF
jgi:23S rRNA pseudouridine2604 synthase